MKVGSRTWLRLVRDGVVAGQYRDPDELCDITEEDQLDELRSTANKTLPLGKQAVRGRGKHKGKLVVRHKPLNPTEMTRYTSKAAARALRQNIDTLEPDGDLETQLEQLILAEMMEGQVRRRNPPPQKRATTSEYEAVEYAEGEES